MAAAMEKTMVLLAILLLLQLIVPASSDAAPGCSAGDVVVSQGQSNALEYQVEIVNHCDRSMCNVHIDCGAFSSFKLVNPSVFSRLSPGDCLVLGGGSLPPRKAVRFVYMSDRMFPMLLKDAILCS